MKQTKLVSIIEVCTNVGTGFLLAMLVWIFVIPTVLAAHGWTCVGKFLGHVYVHNGVNPAGIFLAQVLCGRFSYHARNVDKKDMER